MAELDARAHKLGLVTTVDEIQASYKPSSDDSSGIYRDIRSNLNNSDFNTFTSLLSKSPPSKEGALQALKHLVTVAAQFERAARCRDFAPKRNWQEGAAVVFREYASIKDVCKFFVCRAVIRAMTGNKQESLGDMRLAANVVHHSGVEPTVIGRLVHVALAQIWIRGTQNLAAEFANDPEALASLASMASDFGKPSFVEPFGYEIAITRATFQDIASGKAKIQDFSGDPNDASGLSSMSKQENDNALRLYTSRLLDLADKWSDYSAVVGLIDSWQKTSSSSKTEQLADMMMPIFPQYKVAEMRLDCCLRGMRIGLAAVAYRAALKAWPSVSQAAGLAKVSAADAFGSGELRYLAAGKLLKIYSVGRNGRDDGGKFVPGDKSADDFAQFTVSLH